MISMFQMGWLLSYISIASFSAAIITPALPQMQMQYGLQNGTVEWIVSAFLIGYVVGQLIYGPLANRWGRVFALRLGLVINLIGLLICLLGLATTNFWIIVIGRVISALGAASGLACTYMLINEWVPESQRATAMAYSILSFTFGIGLAVAIGGFLAEYWSWSLCFVVLIVHGLLMLWGTRMFRETLVTPQRINLQIILRNYWQALASPTLIIFSLVVGLCSIMGYCFSAAGPQIASDILHLSMIDYSYWNLLNMLGMLIGGLGAKFLVTRFKPRQVITVGLLGSGVGIASLVWMMYLATPSASWFFLSTMDFYIFGGLLFAAGSIIASTAITDKASGSAMMSFINMLSAALAVILMGYLDLNPLKAFVKILAGTLIVVTGLVIAQYFLGKKQSFAILKAKSI